MLLILSNVSAHDYNLNDAFCNLLGAILYYMGLIPTKSAMPGCGVAAVHFVSLYFASLRSVIMCRNYTSPYDIIRQLSRLTGINRGIIQKAKETI